MRRKKDLHQLYWNEMLPLREIAEICGVCNATIWRRMGREGVPTRTPTEARRTERSRKKTSDLKKGEKNSMYGRRGEKSSMYGVHRYGKDNPNWKGGKHEDSKGYVYIYNPEHPNAHKRGYVLEHRLVMEKKLGRYLTKEEEVHHNKGKQDNLPEDLRLFKSKSEHQQYEHSLRKSNQVSSIADGGI